MTRLLPLALGAAALYCLGGWCVEAHRNRALRRQVDAYQAEDWHTSDDMAEFAGRCAWHARSEMTVPPMVDDHLRESFIAGWREEDARERAEAALWNAGVRG